MHMLKPSSPYEHPLPDSDSIRLLRLLPDKDETAPIQCELFPYTLRETRKRTHLYEALSYVWGDIDNCQSISVGTYPFGVTKNLHAALSHLRDRSLDRIIWIDALCINQGDEEEKAQQIRAMAKIYSQANRVIVWLGETTKDSDRALEHICLAADQSMNRSNEDLDQQAILTLLEKAWFERIWVLQEVAAARHVMIMYGSMEIDGYAFCLGVDSLIDLYKARPDLQGLIHTVTFLIKGTIFRFQHATHWQGRPSLNIRPLSELMDMYHSRKAKVRHDKVYALLGMSSDAADDLNEAGLLPDYKVLWNQLFQRLVKYLLCREVSVETWDEMEVAIIKGKGCVLGKLSVAKDSARDGRQKVDIVFKNISRQPGDNNEWSAKWTLQGLAKPIQDGDVLCLLQGAPKPTIIRARKDHFAIIMIAATPPENIRIGNRDVKWSELLQSANSSIRDFLLVWDWDNSKSQGLEEYENVLRTNNWVSEHLKTKSGGYLEKESRIWDVAVILDDSEVCKQGEERLQKVIRGYQKKFGDIPLSGAAKDGVNAVINFMLAKSGVEPDFKESLSSRTPLSWAAEEGHEALVKLLLETGKVNVNLKDTKYGRTPLSLAAEEGYEAVVKLLLETGKVDVDSKDQCGRTPLLWAAQEGHEAVVKLLLEMGKVDVNSKDKYGRTPLSWAAKVGHEPVVKLLLETGKVDVNSKDQYGQTPLVWAAVEGHEAIVKLLLEMGKVDVDSKDEYGRTPLSWAVKPSWWVVKKGHEAVVKLLLETGKVDVNSKDHYGQTPLVWAAVEGHKDVVKLLLETGKVNVNLKDTKYGRTPLSLAAEEGHEAVVKLLLEIGKVDVDSKDTKYGRTPLSLAAEEGHEAIVKLLLETGKVDVDSKDKYGQTPLSWAVKPPWWAVKEGHEAVVKLLLETGKVDVNSKDQYGRTPLSWAVKEGHEAVVKLLLETGKVDVDLKTINHNWKPVTPVAIKRREAVIELLTKYKSSK